MLMACYIDRDQRIFSTGCSGKLEPSLVKEVVG